MGWQDDEVVEEEKPSRLKRALKAIGETGADAATGGASLAAIADPLLAALGAAGSYVVPGTGKGSFGDRFSNEMEGLRGRREQAFQRSPIAATGTALALGVGGAVPIPTPLSNAAAGGKGALPILARTLAGVGDAAIYSGATAAATNLDRDSLHAAADAATSPWNLLGGIPGAVEGAKAAGKAVGTKVLKKTGQAIQEKLGPATPPKAEPASGKPADPAPADLIDTFVPGFKPSKEAERLQELGVTDLTVGRLSPNSGAGSIEELAANMMGGEGLKQARELPFEQIRQVAIRKAFAPGAKVPDKGTPTSLMEDAYKSFDDAYAQVTGEQVFPAIHGKGLPLQGSKNKPGAFDEILENATADEASINHARKILNNTLTLLPGGAKRPKVVRPVDAGTLIDMRSRIRANIRKYRKEPGKGDVVDILEQANDALTDTIGSQVSQKLSKHLADTDKQYFNLKIVEDAIWKGGDEFKPHHLESADKLTRSRRSHATGDVSDLGELAQLGMDVLTPRRPVTGAQVAAQAPGFKYWGPALGYWMNSPKGRDYLLRRVREKEVAKAAAAPTRPGQPPPALPDAPIPQRRPYSARLLPMAAGAAQPWRRGPGGETPPSGYAWMQDEIVE